MPRDADRLLRLAARAMGRHGLSHAYGHVSMRGGRDTMRVGPPVPLGMTPVGAEAIEVSLEGELPAGVLPEVRMHRSIYRRRPDVGAICRVQPPMVMALSALGETPRCLHGLGSYFAPAAPLWEDPALVRDEARAGAVAERLGAGAAVVLRGNGAVVVGAVIEEAAARTYWLEDAARLEVALLPARASDTPPRPYSMEQAEARAVTAGGLVERMWQYLCSGDPEWQVS